MQDFPGITKRGSGDWLSLACWTDQIGAEQEPAILDQIGWMFIKFEIIHELVQILANKLEKLMDIIFDCLVKMAFQRSEDA